MSIISSHCNIVLNIILTYAMLRNAFRLLLTYCKISDEIKTMYYHSHRVKVGVRVIELG